MKIDSNKIISQPEFLSLQLDILIDVHNFCESKGIRYSLCGGSLIGAVRHKGYIPWDDDIDIMMLRPDYERFLKEYKDDKSYYAIQTYDNDDTCFYAFAKVYDTRTVLIEPGISSGVCIDVFPIDGLENLEDAKCYREEHNQLIAKLCSASRLYRIKIKWQDALICYLRYWYHRLRGINRAAIIRQIKKMYKRYPIQTAPYLCSLNGPYGERDVYPKEVFNEYIKLSFEGHELNCIKDYDTYLSTLYGNYMQLPPEEKRVSHHSHIIYWK